MKTVCDGRHVDNHVLTMINGRQVCAMEECEMGNRGRGSLLIITQTPGY